MVAGASEGMGAAFATYLASEGMNLVLIARNAERLQQLADSLMDTYKTDVLCIVSDLGNANAMKQIEEELNGRIPDP